MARQPRPSDQLMAKATALEDTLRQDLSCSRRGIGPGSRRRVRAL